MTTPAKEHYTRSLCRISAGQVVLWGVAGLLVLGVHVAAAALILDNRQAPAAAEAPPAIMIDLAPVAMAPEAEEVEISPDTVDFEAVEEVPEPPEPVEELAEPEEPVEVPEPVVEPEPEPEPQIMEVEREPDPLEEMVQAQLDTDMPLPIRRPPDVRKKPEPKPQAKPKPRPKQEAAPARRQAKAVAQNAPQTAAPQTSRGSSSSVSPAKWQSRLLAHLERRKRYPSSARRRGAEGVAYVKFSIDGSGNVTSAVLARSSGVPELDAEVVAIVNRASPVPAPPPGAPTTLVVPVRFDLR